MLPDYYKIFGLKKSASKDEIKKRYRQLAKEFHPDVNKSPDATAKMQEILEAYYILGDDEAKYRYDRQYEQIYELQNSTQQEYRNENSQRQSSQKDKANAQDYDDPILEKWIKNAKKQAFDFIRNYFFDSKGIAKSGCLYFFYGLGINILIFILILIIIILYEIFKQ
jgi:DnaJ-class molecular chaperone